jgi:hypothetical protein
MINIPNTFDSQFKNVGQIISYLLPNIIGAAAIVMFLLMIGAGFSMISTAGNEASAQDKAKAQAALTYSVIGFLLVVAAYFILQVVGAVLGVNFLNPTL